MLGVMSRVFEEQAYEGFPQNALQHSLHSTTTLTFQLQHVMLIISSIVTAFAIEGPGEYQDRQSTGLPKHVSSVSIQGTLRQNCQARQLIP